MRVHVGCFPPCYVQSLTACVAINAFSVLSATQPKEGRETNGTTIQRGMYASIFRAPLSAPALDAYSATASNGASNAAAVAACAPLPTRHGLGTGALGRCGRARAAPTCVPDATCSCSPYFLLIFALIFALFWCHVIPYRVICDNGLLWKKCGVAATTNDSSLPRHRCHSFLSRNQSGRAHFAPPRPFLTGGAGPWARHARLRALRPHSRRPDVHPPPTVPVCIFC